MARDYVTEIKSLIDTAASNGWQRCPGKPSTLRRITSHATPSRIPTSWWPKREYEAVEFLSFIIVDRNRAPKVVHGTGRAPWVGRTDRMVSFKRATELMREPVELSPVHTGH